MKLSEYQWDALVDFVQAQAQYEANEIMNRNDSRDRLNLEEAKETCKAALMGEPQSWEMANG